MSKVARPRANEKGKTVDAALTATLNGEREILFKSAVSYAQLASLQVTFSGVVVQLAGFGVARIADAVNQGPDVLPGGDERLSLSLNVDHGDGGASAVTLDWVGISPDTANMVMAVFRAAFTIVE